MYICTYIVPMHIGTYDTNNSVLECTTYFDDALQVVIFSAEALQALVAVRHF